MPSSNAGVRTEIVRYDAGDVAAIGFVASPATPGRHAGVLVAHEGPGLGDHARLRAEMLAGLGYVALAVDLYGNGHVAPSHDATRAQVAALRGERTLLRARVTAGLDALCARPDVDAARLAAIGYCFGGLAVLELARSGAALNGVVTFHGLLDAGDPAEACHVKAAILVCTGAEDTLVPPEQIAAFEREMSQAGVDWQVIRYGGARHAFTNHVDAEPLGKLGFGYDEAADRRSWAAMCCFLEEVLGLTSARGQAG